MCANRLRHACRMPSSACGVPYGPVYWMHNISPPGSVRVTIDPAIALTNDLDEALAGAELVFVAVPSKAIRQVEQLNKGATDVFRQFCL